MRHRKVRDELAADEICRAGLDEECLWALPCHGDDGTWDLLRPAHLVVEEPHTEGPGGALGVYPRRTLPVLLSRNVGDPRNPRDSLLEQLESLADDLRAAGGAQSRDVAAGSGEVADDS